MDVKTITGTLFVKEPNAESDLPNSLSREVPTKRVVQTKFGLFEVDKDNSIKSFLDKWEAKKLVLSDYENRGDVGLDLYESDQDILYYEKYETKPYHLSKETPVLVHFTDIDGIDRDNEVLRIGETYRGSLEGESFTSKMQVFDDLSDSARSYDSVYVLKPETRSFPCVFLTRVEAEDMMDKDVLTVLESF